jgi:hypothetical protein
MVGTIERTLGRESMTTNNNIILVTKFVGEIKGEFFVPSYQRGYRWGEDEVTRLLDDVYQNGKNNYCLQPVVVVKRGKALSMLMGQQRLQPCIYLKYMRMPTHSFSEPAFSISYETREQSSRFFEDVICQSRKITSTFVSLQ